jgi:uroporphyrinogen decarboxylase
MRQAGRFLPEYRELRKNLSFLDLVRSPAACTEAALQPLRRFDLDATIVFSDILVLLDALGAGLRFVAGDGPSLERPLRSEEDARALAWDNPLAGLGYVYEAVAQLRAAAPDRAVIGFAGAPWTLFCYLVDGEGGGDFPRARALLWQEPALAETVLRRLAVLVASHLARQVQAGADVVQVFDTWGGLLPEEDYARFALPGLQYIAGCLGSTPSILFVRGGAHLLHRLVPLGFSALSLDSTTDPSRVHGVATQGNLDNTRLLGPASAIDEGVLRIHRALGGRRNHVFNLGHGVLPQTPPESVAAFVAAVRGLR